MLFTIILSVNCYRVTKIDVVGHLRSFIKRLYDLRMSNVAGNTRSHLLPELYIDNFDNEQIFQQLEIFNNHAVEEHRKAVKSVGAKSVDTGVRRKRRNIASQLSESTTEDDSHLAKKRVTFKSDSASRVVGDNDDFVAEEVDADIDSDIDSEGESVLQKLLDSMNVKKNAQQQNNDGGDDDENEDDDNDDEDSETRLNSDSSDDDSDTDVDRTASLDQCRIEPKQKSDKVSAVDDQFFKLSEMEAFLDEQDLKEEQRQKHEHIDGDEYSEDDDDDLSMEDKVVKLVFVVHISF